MALSTDCLPIGKWEGKEEMALSRDWLSSGDGRGVETGKYGDW